MLKSLFTTVMLALSATFIYAQVQKGTDIFDGEESIYLGTSISSQNAGNCSI